MLARIFSAATLGLESRQIEVEVDVVERSFPTFKIVGLPDKAVEEAKERIRSAIDNSGVSFPRHKVIINLAPADLPKVGPSFDLPMALGILVASGQIPPIDLEKTLILGELSLDGAVRRVNGVLPMVMAAREWGFKQVFLPAANRQEAAAVGEMASYPVSSLKELLLHFGGEKPLEKIPPLNFGEILSRQEAAVDFADIIGQDNAKRALVIAAAGGHNLFMQGPPGAGKTMLAQTIPGILPALTEEEALEVTKIYSVAGLLANQSSLVVERPFRSPHHTISRVGLIGGGSHPTPGEISLAHRGVLFLDELPEFPRHVLEALRQPMESGQVIISRAAGSCLFPARFILVAAANPCPCGFLGDPKHTCRCLPGEIARYRKKISGPLLDRIDLHLAVPAVEIKKLTGETPPDQETSKEAREKIEKARLRQRKRFSKTSLTCNAEMGTREVKQFCFIQGEAREILSKAAERLHLSARAYFRTLKVAQTIADLAGEEQIKKDYIFEALQYRSSALD